MKVKGSIGIKLLGDEMFKECNDISGEARQLVFCDECDAELGDVEDLQDNFGKLFVIELSFMRDRGKKHFCNRVC